MKEIIHNTVLEYNSNPYNGMKCVTPRGKERTKGYVVVTVSVHNEVKINHFKSQKASFRYYDRLIARTNGTFIDTSHVREKYTKRRKGYFY